MSSPGPITTWVLTQSGKIIKATVGSPTAKKGVSLTGLLSASIYGISLTENPAGYVAGIVVDMVVGYVFGFFGTIAALIGTVFDQLIDTLEGTGVAVTAPFGTAGDSVMSLVAEVNEIIVGLASMAGPLAPLVAITFWIIVFLAIGFVGRVLLEVIKWVT